MVLFHTPGRAFMANGGGDIGNMIPYEHKVLYVKEGVNFLKILLFLVVKVYSSIPLSHTNNNNKSVARSNTATSFKSDWHINYKSIKVTNK